ncbi:MAG TPA: c-type cytochrome, partial [Edaphobacter sp.]|nr:c-type cytochrome [Edaphobacter sp.]
MAVLATVTTLSAQDFHNAPASAAGQENPFSGQANAQAGGELYQQKCAACHGQTAQGSGNIPALASGPAHAAKPGELFWYITRGDLANG